MTKSKLIFASHNPNKCKEVQALLSTYQILSLAELDYQEDIAETGATLRENAAIKARCIHAHFGLPVFADDTGLMVDALAGAPGVYSARYAGSKADAQANMQLLLRNLTGKTERAAHFSTFICYIDEAGQEHFFEGRVDGLILETPRGGEGFGYDPIFQPLGFAQSFAEMDAAQKNKISHRGRALQALLNFLAPSQKS